jgi:hypothetical protein
MNRTIAVAVVATLVLLVGVTGTAAAQPGDGPPDDLPSPVPDFVTDLLGGIADFLGGLLDAVGGLVSDVTPNGSGGSAVGGPN